MYTTRSNNKCYECKGHFASRQSLQKALCKDGKQHFICQQCVEKRTTQETIMVMQCSCGNMAASSTMKNGLCIPCQRKAEQEQNAAPFTYMDVVKFIPMYAKEYTGKGKHYAIVDNCINYGSVEKPNWALQVQFLKEGDGELKLTPVIGYMIASWQVEKCHRAWTR